MAIPSTFRGLKLPAIAAPMFLVSGPDLVVAACDAGVIGTFPALNRRDTAALTGWLDEIEERRTPEAAPYGINLIVHRSNVRLDADLECVVARRVPLVITSLGTARDVVNAVHSYGGLVFHDVTNLRHAEKAAEVGVDGLIAVAAGAGGHAGTLSPFALLTEIREIFGGTLVLSGAINTGAQIAAARIMGADLAYLGTRFLATREAYAAEDHKRMLVEAKAADILYTASVSGVPANFLRQSIRRAGLDPDGAPVPRDLTVGDETRAWRDIWSAGQGVGAIRDLPSVEALCARLIAEYRAATALVARDPFGDPEPRDRR